MTFPDPSRAVKAAALTGLFAVFATNLNDLQGKDSASVLIANQHAMANTLAVHTNQLLDKTTRPLTITQFVSNEPVTPLDVDSVAATLAPVLDFSSQFTNHLANGIRDYQSRQGYKYFDAASQYVLSDLSIRNQTFIDVIPSDKRLLDSAGIVDPKTNRIVYPTYTAHPKKAYLDGTAQEKLHNTHWQTALNFAAIGYADTLAKATWAGAVRDSISWQNWHQGLMRDEGFIPGAGGRVDELGAFCDQRFGTFTEETERHRGVHEGRHGGSSEHYSAKYIERKTTRSEAIDIFGPGRNYGHTKLLDSIYQHHVLPHRDIVGVPRALMDSVKSKTEGNRYVNPGRAVWYFRGHYGDHIHVSATRQCAELYAGQDAVADQDKRRAHITALFNHNRRVPTGQPYKTLDSKKNIIVMTRDSITALNPEFPWIQDVQELKRSLMPKPAKVKASYKRNKKRVTTPSRAASHPQANARHSLHNG